MYSQNTSNVQMGRSVFCLFERQISKQTNVSKTPRLVSTKLSMFTFKLFGIKKTVKKFNILAIDGSACIAGLLLENLLLAGVRAVGLRPHLHVHDAGLLQPYTQKMINIHRE
jgi:hypothetical protein